jgi:polyferredoxin
MILTKKRQNRKLGRVLAVLSAVFFVISISGVLFFNSPEILFFSALIAGFIAFGAVMAFATNPGYAAKGELQVGNSSGTFSGHWVQKVESMD